MIVLAACVIGGLSVALCLGQVLESEHLREVGRRARHGQFTIRQMMAAVVVAALLFTLFLGPVPEASFAFALLCLGFLVWFVRVWQREFVFLMGLRDADFPGRHDKVIWAITLLAFAPVGAWFFRVYRLAHWPEPEPSIAGEGHAEEPGNPATQPA